MGQGRRCRRPTASGARCRHPADPAAALEKLRKRPATFAEAVLDDPESRRAYFGATEGVLHGRHDDEELRRARDLLDEARVAYLYTPGSGCGQPLFLAAGAACRGVEQIERHISRRPPPAAGRGRRTVAAGRLRRWRRGAAAPPGGTGTAGRG